ncbi:MAG: LOG family protein [Candidatus Omnitrophota bacterium]
MSQNPKRSIRRISVLGSGKVPEKDPVYRQAVELGQVLAQKGFTIFHGGFGGVMKAVAKGSQKAKGRNIGVTIRGASKKANPLVDAEIRMPCWQSRLFKLVEKGEAYIFLDGATGTLAELFVILEMTNRGLLSKPIIILGKRLHKLMRFLKKDISVNIPQSLSLTSSTAQAVKILRGWRG